MDLTLEGVREALVTYGDGKFLRPHWTPTGLRLLQRIGHAAARGERCPANDELEQEGFSTCAHMLGALARAGFLRIEVGPANWRVVHILKGPHAGHNTALPAPPRKWTVGRVIGPAAEVQP